MIPSVNPLSIPPLFSGHVDVLRRTSLADAGMAHLPDELREVYFRFPNGSDAGESDEGSQGGRRSL